MGLTKSLCCHYINEADKERYKTFLETVSTLVDQINRSGET